MNSPVRPLPMNHVWLALLLSASLSSCASMEEAEPVDWREEPHHLSVLFAGTFEDEEEAPSIGIDYEYRVSDFLGLGAVAEYAFEDIDATTLIAALDLHITNQFICQTGPGIEFVESEEEFVYRLGFLYEWEMGEYTLSPQVHYDATSGEDAVVAGLAVGFAF